MDSGIYYLSVALNKQLSNADCYIVEQNTFVKELELDGTMPSIDYTDLQILFEQISQFAKSSLNSIETADTSDLVIFNISIEKPSNMEVMPLIDKKIRSTVRIGRRNLIQIW